MAHRSDYAYLDISSGDLGSETRDYHDIETTFSLQQTFALICLRNLFSHKKEFCALINLHSRKSKRVYQQDNAETFLFSKIRDDQLIMTCIDCLKIRFELFRIDPDLRLKFVHSVAELATGAFEMDSLSIRALGAGVSLHYLVLKYSPTLTKKTKRLAIIDQEKNALFALHSRKYQFLSQEPHNKANANPKVLLCECLETPGKPELAKLAVYKNKLQFLGLDSNGLDSVAQADKFVVQISGDRRIDLKNLYSGKSGKSFVAPVDSVLDFWMKWTRYRVFGNFLYIISDRIIKLFKFTSGTLAMMCIVADDFSECILQTFRVQLKQRRFLVLSRQTPMDKLICDNHKVYRRSLQLLKTSKPELLFEVKSTSGHRLGLNSMKYDSGSNTLFLLIEFNIPNSRISIRRPIMIELLMAFKKCRLRLRVTIENKDYGDSYEMMSRHVLFGLDFSTCSIHYQLILFPCTLKLSALSGKNVVLHFDSFQGSIKTIADNTRSLHVIDRLGRDQATRYVSGSLFWQLAPQRLANITYIPMPDLDSQKRKCIFRLRSNSLTQSQSSVCVHRQPKRILLRLLRRDSADAHEVGYQVRAYRGHRAQRGRVPLERILRDRQVRFAGNVQRPPEQAGDSARPADFNHFRAATRRFRR